MYLGKLFCFDGTHDLELQNRISKAWAAFGAYSDELTDRRLDLKLRFQLFQSVVQPTFLYGCSSWTLTREREQLIQSTQRKMMRKIVGTRRRVLNGELESWLDWIVPATRLAEEARAHHGVPEWVEEVHRRRYRWASAVACRNDGRWTKEILSWTVTGVRRQARPFSRWTDSFRRFFEHMYGVEAATCDWLEIAADKQAWANTEADYLHWTLGH